MADGYHIIRAGLSSLTAGCLAGLRA